MLYPRTTGFNYIVKTMIGNDTIDCIQDVTIAYNGGKVPESEFDFLKGHLPREIHFYVDKFSLKEILAAPVEQLEPIAVTSNHNHNHNHNDINGNQKNIDDERQNKILEAWLYKRWSEKEAFLKK